MARYRYRFWHDYYSPATPKEVKDGVKLQSGKIGATWWSERWISLLDSFGWSNRLDRGRRYARRGQVIDFKIEPGVVKARVQGTTSRPYSITIKISKLSDKEWQKAIKVMSSKAIFAAKLLAGQMPQNIEEAFAKSKISLFPKKEKDLKSDCSCPDWANPCKHIAAVHYVLADEFDRDPFMIFKMRGKSKDEIMGAISKQWAGTPDKEESPLKDPQQKQRVEKLVPLEECIHKFWKSDDKLQKFHIDIQPPEVPLALIRRLGPPSFWHGSPDFHREMERIYRVVTKKVMDIAYRD